MIKRFLLTSIVLLSGVAVTFPQGVGQFQEILTGFEEVPAVSTQASGEFSTQISLDETEISHELSYSGLTVPGEGRVTAAHIHLGQAGVNGGASVFLCSNIRGPACPTPSGTLTGTLTARDVIGPVPQGIAPGEFAVLVRAIRAGVTYVAVHSTNFPGGEIRAQIDPRSGR